MKYLWTWSGNFFGYREDNELWTYKGKHVGKIYDDEIYDSKGRYLEEIMAENRLIVNGMKKNFRKWAFTPYFNRWARIKMIDYVGYVMYLGYTSFPIPETFS